MSLEGQRILITGAARRIGRSLALAVARQGADVVLHYGHSIAEAIQAQAEIQSLGRQAELLQADLGDSQAVAGIIGRALENGPLDALVNNAAIFEPGTLATTTLEAWERHLRINLTAPFLLSQAFAASLANNRPGRIVNILDWRAFRPGRDHLPYTISKAALAALTSALALALAPQISVNGLAFGAILPPSDGSDTSKILEDIPAGRWAHLKEVDEALLFLLAGPAYITGEIIHVDGGRHLV